MMQSHLWRLWIIIYNYLYPVHPFLYAIISILIYCATNILLALLYPAIITLIIRLFLRHVVYSYHGGLFEPRSKPSTATKFIGICFKVCQKLFPTPLLHSYDCGLMPSLPLPKLKSTIDRYRTSLKPLLSEAEYDDLVTISDQFLNDEGPILQMHLYKYSWLKSNWVTEWWTKYAYLKSRKGLLINSSISNVDLFKVCNAYQAARAANVIYFDTKRYLQIEDRTFQPLVKFGKPLTGTHYDLAYATTRVPEPEIDRLQHWSDTKHVAIYYKGYWFKLDIIDANSRQYNAYELEKALQEIIDSTTMNESIEETRIASLTTTDRSIWAENRKKYFLSNAINVRSLETIESALYVIILHHNDDGNLPNGSTDSYLVGPYLRHALTGDGINRWADKSMNIAISITGRPSATIEHSWGDGFEFAHIRELLTYEDNFVQTYTDDGHCKGIITAVPKFEKLHWQISDQMKSEINSAYVDIRRQIENFELYSIIFRDWGKGEIKKCRVSPDGFIQMAIQLAYYRTHRKFVLTYESGSQRFFADGRTETVRVVSMESVEFVRYLCNNADTLDVQHARCLLNRAIDRQTQINREAMTGQGIDRHLFALYIISQGTDTKSLFLDRLINQRWILSTSQAPTVTELINEDKYVDLSFLGATFGPVDPDGYGVCYRCCGDHSIVLHVTSFKNSKESNCLAMRNSLKQALFDLKSLFN